MASNASAHPLRYPWTFWYSKKELRNKMQAPDEFVAAQKEVATFSSVEEFWSLYAHMVLPDTMKPGDIHLFKKGIRPIWEDPQNSAGGDWKLKLNKGVAARLWEQTALALIGDAFADSEDICGAVLTVRPYSDAISVWHKSAANSAVRERIKATLIKALDLDKSVDIEYHEHHTTQAE